MKRRTAGDGWERIEPRVYRHEELALMVAQTPPSRRWVLYRDNGTSTGPCLERLTQLGKFATLARAKRAVGR